MKKNMWLWLGAFAAVSVFAQEPGAPILADNFDTAATFAERWVPKDKRIKPGDGSIVFPSGGTLTMRADTPQEFYAEMDITLDMSHQPDKSKWTSAFCGFRIEGFSFFVLPSGSTWMIYQLKGYSRPHGKQVAIDGFEFGKPVRLTLIRRIDNGAATYLFRVNGKDAGSFVHDAPVPVPGPAGQPERLNPLEIFSYNVTMTLDNFNLSSVKRSADDSPNVIFNSSFEHAQDGFPLYFCRSGFNMAKAPTVPYEDFLAMWTLDTAEKHSGRQSLRVAVDKDLGGGTLWAWGAGTVKGSPGVFSAWMKADRENFPVSISYGKAREVKVGTSWQRYEVVNTNLPGAGVYSPVTISASKTNGTLWVDDLQAEFLGPVDEAKLKAGETFATSYKPSELDRQRFGKQDAPVRAPSIAIRKLPAGLVPAGDLDAWKGKAAKVDAFYFKDKKARNETEAYLACDDRHLYIGYRCFVEDLAAVSTNREPHDSFSAFSGDSVEFFLDPGVNGAFYQFAVDAGGTRTDIGPGGNVAWNGDWSAKAKLNPARKSIDYEIVVPFATLAEASMQSRWLVNVCRNDRTVREQVAVTRTPIGSFKKVEYWPYAQLPPEVVTPFSLGVAAGSCSGEGGATAVALSVNNLSGKERPVRVELLDTQGEGGSLAAKDVVLRPGANELTLACAAAPNRVRVKLAEGGLPVADQLVTLEKRTPVSMLGRLSYYMNETEAAFRVTANVPDAESLTAVLSVAGQTVRRPAAAAFTIAVPLKGVPDGTNAVTLALTKEGRTVAETSSTLVKRPYRAGSGQVNHFTRSLIHDGKPVFQFAPFFVFVKPHSKDYVLGTIDWANRYGFRYLHILVDNRAVDQSVWALEAAQQKGIRVMLWTKYYEMPDDQAAALRQRLDFPNVMAQMVLDEPELGMPSDSARAYLRKMRAFYPYHPVHMNNTVLGVPNRYADLETDILMLDDYLTNTEGRDVPSVVDATDIMWKAGQEEGKPCFYFLAGGNFPLHYREPSYAHQVAQTYGNIAAGCMGLSYFYGAPATPGNWKAYTQLNKEILALSDVLLSEEEIAPATSSADPKTLRCITRKHDGAVYVVACNIRANPIDAATFTLPAELGYEDKAEVMFEDRTVPVVGGALKDAFAGYSRHVYKVKLVSAAGAP